MAVRNKISRATEKSLGVKWTMAFDSEQRAIRNGAFVALMVTIAAFSACVLIDLPMFETSDVLHGKGNLAIIVAVLASCLAVAIMNVANQRFFEPLDRNAAAATTATEKSVQLQAILRNTHEQVTIAALVYIVALLTLPPKWTDAIMVAAILFVFGRIFFTRGYSKGAAGRAFGFGLTFYPSILLALLSLYTALF